MQLSMQFVYTKLQEKWPEVQWKAPKNMNPLCCYVCVMNVPPTNPHCIHVDFEQDITPANAATLNVPVMVSVSKEHLYPLCPRIILPDRCSIASAFNYTLSVFEHFQSWSEKIFKAILTNQTLREILEITQTVVDNPMYFADASFKMLAYIGEDMEELSATFKYQMKYGYLPYNVMTNLVETGELSLLNRTSGAFLARVSSFVIPFVSKAIRYQDNVKGYFFILEMYNRTTCCDLEIAEFLGELFSTASFNNQNYLTINQFYHEHFMIEILEGTLRDETSIKNQLNPLGWALKSDYTILVIAFDEDDGEALIRHTISLISGEYDSQSFIYDNNAVFVYHNIHENRKKLIRYLKNTLEKINKTGALSEPFTRFDDMNIYYQQATFTLKYQKGANLSGRLFVYENIFLWQHRIMQ